MTTNKRFRDAITKSVELEKVGEHASALELWDQAIAEAIGTTMFRGHAPCATTRPSCRDLLKDWALAKRYYQQSLASDPENARALYGLAGVALDEGDPATARQYAKRCRMSILLTDDEILRVGLLDLIAKNWPDVVEN